MHLCLHRKVTGDVVIERPGLFAGMPSVGVMMESV
jgi:hypothetical protein